MASLVTASSLGELKSLYRRYAGIHHPDKGGCHLRMQKLNKQYRIMKQRLKFAANDADNDSHDFSNIQVGCKLYVNNTPSEVLEVSEHFFRVVAVGRNRQAVFKKSTGYGRFNPRLKAGFRPRSS